jgi:hypothetical protein
MGEASEIVLMFLLSLWKVFIAYGYLAYESYSFVTANTIVFSAVICSNLLSYWAFSKMQNYAWFEKFKFSKVYLRGAVFYSKYGFYPSALLAPILLGIPTFSLVSFVFSVSNKKVLSALLVSSLLWGAVIYLAFYYSLDWF